MTVGEHIGWLKMYVDGMAADNWQDMCLRCERQLNELTAALSEQVVVPKEPTEEMWGGLARDLVMWDRGMPNQYGSTLYRHLRSTGKDIPDWLLKEIPDIDHTPPKGTVAACIYKAMIAAAPPPASPAGEG